jgi:putative membrane protein
MFAFTSLLFAQQAQPLPIWDDPLRFGMSVLATVVFGVVGIALAIIGFKLFDLFSPGNLETEIVQKQNIAAAILGAAIIIGICLIVSHAMS